MKRLIGFMTALVLLLAMCPVRSQATVPDDFKGLVLTAPADVTVKLYTGFSDGSVVTPTYTEEGETNAYYYSDLTEKYYRFVSSGTGYYKLTQNIYMTTAKANTKLVIDANPGKKAGTGWEPSAVVGYTAESTALALAGTAEDWPDYADVFTTPAFTPGRAAHQMTTQAEMEAYIKALDDANDNMYIYSIGESAGGLDIPIVVFTKADLSEADDLEAAAEAMGKDKTTILMRSYVHGNEPAAGEAALSIIRRLDENGADTLDKINFCIIPRANPDGSYNFRRYLNNDVDPNRDFMRASSVETVAFLKTYRTLAPEVVFDGHEYLMNSASSVLAPGDIMASMGYTNRNSDAFFQTGMDMIQDAFTAMEENGLSYRYYNNELNANNANISRTYSAHQGTLCILMESRGINYGLSGFPRRVVSNVITTEAMIDYVAEHATEIKQLVAGEKSAIVSAGTTYEESDKLILSTGAVDVPERTITGTRVGQTGATKQVDYVPHLYTVEERTRPAPTAYVIPAGQSYTQAVLDLMDKQGIAYSFLAPNSSVSLQQYIGTVTEAALAEESVVNFPDGAYVFYMNQERGITLAMLMEPDVDDLSSHNGTLAQQGVLTPTDGVFPIYRYIHDLNENGTLDFGETPSTPTGLEVNNPGKPGQTGSITGLDAQYAYEYRAEGETTYTKVPVGTTAIDGLEPGTYYVRFQATNDSLPSSNAVLTLQYTDYEEHIVYLNSSAPAGGDGSTQEKAVNTIEAAYSQLDKQMADASEIATGKIVISGTYTLLAAPTVLPSHTYPVVIAGATQADGLDYATTETEQGLRQIQFNGPTTLENMTLTYSSSQSLSYLCAQGHPFTVGNNVITVPNSRNVYFCIMGGYYDATGTAASTDLTILSGTWRNIYANGFYGILTGDAKLTIDGGKASHTIQSGYAGAIGGNVTLSMANTSGNALYCGNAKRGNLAGDVTLTLGENVTIPNICAGSRDAGNVDGTVTVIVDGIDLTANAIHGRADNTAGTIGGLKLVMNKGELADVADTFVTRDGVEIILGCRQTKAVTLNNQVKLDMNGNDLACTLSEGGALSVKDSQTDDFDITDGVYGKLTATGEIRGAEATALSNPYLMITEEDGTASFHAVGLNIQSMALNPDTVGLYYNNTFNGDHMVKEKVLSYGVAMSVVGAPTAETMGSTSKYTRFEGNTFGTGESTSSMLYNVMKVANGATINKTYAAMPVYGRAYIQTGAHEYLFGVTRVRSLQQQVELADRDYFDTYQTQLTNLYNIFKDAMEDWSIPNLLESLK